MLKISLTVCFISIIHVLGQDDVGSSGGVTFQTEGLAKKKSCKELTRNDCLFYHEAQDKCGSVCDDKIKNGDKDDKTDKGKKKPSRDGKKDRGCFHGDDLVITESGPVAISKLVGVKDVRVLARGADGRTAFSRVYYWIHASESTEHEFLELGTASGHQLSITRDHLIYRTDCRGGARKAVFAARVQPGSCVLVREGTSFVESQVVARSVGMKRGIYAPITDEGSVVVNGVLASCFARLENEPLQTIMYAYMDRVHRLLTSLVSQNAVALFYGSPFSQSVGIPEVLFSFWDLAKKFVR